MRVKNVSLTGRFLAIVLLLNLLSACSSKEKLKTSVIFLGHKGAGSNYYNVSHLENTLGAFREGAEKLDGVEADVQMSLDGTLWIFHDENVNKLNCEVSLPDTIPLMYDEEISKIQLCYGGKKDRIYKLSELIDFWNASPGGFYISLDIKTDFTQQTFRRLGGREAYLLKFAENLAKTVQVFNHPGKLMVEVDSKPFCDKLKSFPTASAIKTCLIRYVKMEDRIQAALDLGYDGISCNFDDPSISRENIKEARDKGLIVQLWTPYYRDDLLETIRLEPDFIQTDNIRTKTGLNIE